MLLQQYFSWLKKENYIDLVNANYPNYRNILTGCLGATDEDALIIGDIGYPGKPLSGVMAASYYLAAKELGIKSKLVIQKPKGRGDEADKAVVSAMDNLKDGSILILSISSRLGSLKHLGKSYRTFALSRGHRFISTPSLGNISPGQYNYLLESINIDYQELQKRCLAVKNKLLAGEELHIASQLGTDLYYGIDKKHIKSNDGCYMSPGSGGNIPAGEVYLPPSDKIKVNGKIVIDSTISLKGRTMLVKDPVTFFIEDGQIVSIEGKKEAKLLIDTFQWAEGRAKYPWGIRRLGEFGIGLNPKAKAIGATILDEKVFGTAHIAFGSNSWFGGSIKAITHFDQVFKDPKIYIDGALLTFD